MQSALAAASAVVRLLSAVVPVRVPPCAVDLSFSVLVAVSEQFRWMEEIREKCDTCSGRGKVGPTIRRLGSDSVQSGEIFGGGVRGRLVACALRQVQASFLFQL